MSRLGAHAVVLGGSIAGLLAARVLADAYAEVTVVDRDDLGGGTGHRRGVPQGRHIHGLQARGQRIVEELLPGVTAELADAGAVTSDVGRDTRWYFPAGRLRNFTAGRPAIAASRPFFEAHLRARVAALPNVRVVDRCDAQALVFDAHRTRVTGVEVRHGDAAPSTLTADLVVDASGRGSRVPAWLLGAGYPKVEEEKSKIGLGYTTRLYRLLTDTYDGDVTVAVVASPRHPRGAVCAKVEHDTVLLTAYGILGDHPPTDPDGFDAFVDSLPVPDVRQVLRGAEPLGDPVAYRFPANLRRRYEQAPRLPDGLLALGDSVCSFNPTYAQGMTVAALGALTLRRHLSTGATPRPTAYFRDLAAEALDGPWEMMIDNDLAFPGVEGDRTAKVRISHAYGALVQAAATRDERVADAFLRVVGLIDPPTALLRPATLLRVLRGALARAPRTPPTRPSRVTAPPQPTTGRDDTP
ncbi:FAD-dependent oxidoreductase [Saccharothrix deserti]|uniref:FAD-dependent oxidoreductase n=1 Tax=Saccharothrix deserti TaxID=2593674 RepID=UPI00131B6404|nr:FAD-dependent oxidoreductase [Saccharothrix deserti]